MPASFPESLFPALQVRRTHGRALDKDSSEHPSYAWRETQGWEKVRDLGFEVAFIV